MQAGVSPVLGHDEQQCAHIVGADSAAHVLLLYYVGQPAHHQVALRLALALLQRTLDTVVLRQLGLELLVETTKPLPRARGSASVSRQR